MSDREKDAMKELSSQIDKLDLSQIDRLSLIAQGMAIEADRHKKKGDQNG